MKKEIEDVQTVTEVALESASKVAFVYNNKQYRWKKKF